MTQALLVENAKNNVDLILKPIKGGETISEASLSTLIEASIYKNLKVNSSNIKNAVAELNDVLKPLQEGNTGREIVYQILERVDATITVSIETDEMGATAEITTAQGGKNLTAKAILAAAQGAGVKKGFSKEHLVKLAHLAAKEAPNSSVTMQIATGKLAVNGEDAKIKPLVQSAQARILQPKVRDNGSVDMRNLGDIICVKVGDPLAKKVPLTQGKAGFTVTASPLEAEPGVDIDLIPGEGTAISPENEDVLISELVGLPKFIDNGMEVDEVYQIKNVDVSTGHVKFEGSVIIDGDVCEGMRVETSGDITVGGFVESATLKAGGDITITGGIIGRKFDVENTKSTDVTMSVTVEAKGNIFAKYCQYAELNCKSNIRIENQLMHSKINIYGRLWVGSEEKANGKLIGGFIKAGTSIHAGIIGATAGSNTIINFYYQLQEFKEQIDKIDIQVKNESDKTNEIKNTIKKLKELPKGKVKPEVMTKLLTTYKFHAAEMGKYLSEKETIDQELQAYMTSVYIEATEKLYHGVEMTVGEFHERSRREYGPTKMTYNERKVHIEPIIHTS